VVTEIENQEKEEINFSEIYKKRFQMETLFFCGTNYFLSTEMSLNLTKVFNFKINFEVNFIPLYTILNNREIKQYIKSVSFQYTQNS